MRGNISVIPKLIYFLAVRENGVLAFGVENHYVEHVPREGIVQNVLSGDYLAAIFKIYHVGIIISASRIFDIE